MRNKLDRGEMELLQRIEEVALQHIREHSYVGHDQTHTIRVQKLSRVIGKREKANLLVLEAAALLHDLGRSFPDADHAQKSAEIAEPILRDCHFPEAKIPDVLYAIRVHRFSRGQMPKTIEAKILQDADRVDISGAVGAAMAFAYGGSKNMEMYDHNDPLAWHRKLDDNKFVLDHFKQKLVKLPETIHTKTGRNLIRSRSRYLKSFLRQFVSEIRLPD